MIISCNKIASRFSIAGEANTIFDVCHPHVSPSPDLFHSGEFFIPIGLSFTKPIVYDLYEMWTTSPEHGVYRKYLLIAPAGSNTSWPIVCTTISYDPLPRSFTSVLLRGVSQFLTFYKSRDISAFTYKILQYKNMFYEDSSNWKSVNDELILDTVIGELCVAETLESQQKHTSNYIELLQNWELLDKDIRSYAGYQSNNLLGNGMLWENIRNVLMPDLVKFPLTQIDQILIYEGKLHLQLHDMFYLDAQRIPIHFLDIADFKPPLQQCTDMSKIPTVFHALLRSIGKDILENNYLDYRISYTKGSDIVSDKTAKLYMYKNDRCIYEHILHNSDVPELTLLINSMNELTYIDVVLHRGVVLFRYEYAGKLSLIFPYSLALHTISNGNLYLDDNMHPLPMLT